MVMGGVPEYLLDKMNRSGERTIERDRRCVNCDYNLRGLSLGSVCPECGTPIRDTQGIDDPLLHMPLDVIRRFSIGCWICLAVAVCYIGLTIWEIFGAGGVQTSAALVAMAVLWCTGVWLITPGIGNRQGKFYGFRPRDPLRWASRTLNLGWLLVAAAIFLLATVPNAATSSGSLLFIMLIVGGLIGLLGLIAVAVMMQRLAAWMRDDDAQRLLNLFAWLFPASLVLSFLNLPIPLLGIIIGLAFLASLVAFPWGMFHLARSASYSIQHAREEQQRMQRRLQRANAYNQQIAENVEQVGRATSPQPRQSEDTPPFSE